MKYCLMSVKYDSVSLKAENDIDKYKENGKAYFYWFNEISIESMAKSLKVFLRD